MSEILSSDGLKVSHVKKIDRKSQDKNHTPLLELLLLICISLKILLQMLKKRTVRNMPRLKRGTNCGSNVFAGELFQLNRMRYWNFFGQGTECRFNLIIQRILRNDADPEVRKLTRSLLSAKCALQKDRMDFNLVLEACQPGVIDLLRDVKMVTATLLPGFGKEMQRESCKGLSLSL